MNIRKQKDGSSTVPGQRGTETHTGTSTHVSCWLLHQHSHTTWEDAVPESHHQEWERETGKPTCTTKLNRQKFGGQRMHKPHPCPSIHLPVAAKSNKAWLGLLWLRCFLLLGKGEEEDLILELFSNLNNSTWNEAYPWQSWTFTPAGSMEAHNAWKQNAISKTKDRSNWRNSFHITKPWVKVVTHPTAQVTDTILQKGISEFSITSDSFFTKGNQLYFNFWVDGWEQIIKWKLPPQTSIAHKKKSK